MPLKIGQSADHGFDQPLGLLSDCHRRIEQFLAILTTIAERRSGGPLTGSERAQLEGAVDALRNADDVEVLSVSPWSETRAVGGPAGQPDYLNGVLEARTTLAPEDLLWLLQRIETQFGRDRAREVRHGPRTLDLDLLLYDDIVLETAELVLPHPRMEERLFVLEPLCALAPQLRLRRSGRTACEQLEFLRARAGRG